jgi:hypothetical protein
MEAGPWIVNVQQGGGVNFYGEKIKTQKCLRNTNTSFSLILINFIQSDRFRFGPTDFHGLSDRMSDTFFMFWEVCVC